MLFIVNIICAGFYLYLNVASVHVIDAHHNADTADILVDRLPHAQRASIRWWAHRQDEIFAAYAIPFGDDGPVLIRIYAFGEGYKNDDDKTRLCFSDVRRPDNCIDQDVLMTVSRMPDGENRYAFTSETWIRTATGGIYRVSHPPAR